MPPSSNEKALEPVALLCHEVLLRVLLTVSCGGAAGHVWSAGGRGESLGSGLAASKAVICGGGDGGCSGTGDDDGKGEDADGEFHDEVTPL